MLSTQAMVWQQKACAEEDPQLSGRHWLHAATLYNIAAYPHLKGDDLAEQAQALSNRAYEEAAQRLPGTMPRCIGILTKVFRKSPAGSKNACVKNLLNFANLVKQLHHNRR